MYYNILCDIIKIKCASFIFFVLESCTKDMPYEMCDQISAAMMSACVECERLAFLDGVALGGKLIMELVKL